MYGGRVGGKLSHVSHYIAANYRKTCKIIMVTVVSEMQ